MWVELKRCVLCSNLANAMFMAIINQFMKISGICVRQINMSTNDIPRVMKPSYNDEQEAKALL